MLPMGQAAKHVGVSKAALSRAFRIGQIHAIRNASDGWNVDPPDLFRVNPDSAGTVSGNSFTKRNATLANVSAETSNLMARIDVEIDWLKAQMEQVKMMRQQLADMKVRSEKWQDEVQPARASGFL